jgi:hypothetical protein
MAFDGMEPLSVCKYDKLKRINVKMEMIRKARWNYEVEDLEGRTIKAHDL